MSTTVCVCLGIFDKAARISCTLMKFNICGPSGLRLINSFRDWSYTKVIGPWLQGGAPLFD